MGKKRRRPVSNTAAPPAATGTRTTNDAVGRLKASTSPLSIRGATTGASDRSGELGRLDELRNVAVGGPTESAGGGGRFGGDDAATNGLRAELGERQRDFEVSLRGKLLKDIVIAGLAVIGIVVALLVWFSSQETDKINTLRDEILRNEAELRADLRDFESASARMGPVPKPNRRTSIRSDSASH